MGPRLKLPKYINGFIDRHGRPRFYIRRPGFKAAPLPGLPYSPEFMAAYTEALGTPPVDVLGKRTNNPGTINALVVAYYGSAAWAGLAPQTQQVRRRFIERFREQHGDKRVVGLQRGHIERMLGAIPKLTAKRDWMKAIRGLLQAAIPGMRADNPTDGIASIRLPKNSRPLDLDGRRDRAIPRILAARDATAARDGICA